MTESFLAVPVVAAFGGIVYFALWLSKRLKRPELYGLSREEIQRRWKQVRETSKMNGQMGMKVAVMEADMLLDTALKSLSMPGETLGERLKMACYSHPQLKNVWWAHKIRNQLVHDSTFRLNLRQGEQALDEFERALKVLNIL